MKKLLLISLIGILSGCVSTSNPTQSWATYYDKADMPAKKMRFMKIVQPSGKKIKQFDNVGSFYISGEREINIFIYDQEKTFSLIDLDTNKPIDKLNKSTFTQLNKVKSLRFYEFGQGLIEIADYRSESGICKDFFSPKGITVDFTTNYHFPNDEGVVVSFAQAELIAKTGSRVKNISIGNYLTSSNKQQIIQQFEKIKQQAVKADSQKLGRFLLSVVCNTNNKM